MASTPTPWTKTVYQALTAAGASTVQAIGIMANAINESGFNPEAVGDQGTSFGLVQEHGSQYAGLVTGNRDTDLAAQVRQIALNGGFKAASGATPAEAAGNFAANYERCVGCQPGGAQYNSRVANASVVAGWVSSGKWPQSAGAATASDTGTSAQAGPDCALSLGGQHIGIFFGHGPSLPSACLIRKTEVRAVLGAMILVGGAAVALPGLVIMLVYAARASGATRAMTQAAGAVPGYGRVVRRASGAAAARRIPAAPRAGGVTERQAQTRARRAYASGLFEGRAQAGPSEQNLDELVPA